MPYRPAWIHQDDTDQPGAVLAWRKDGDGWLALARYRVGLLQYERWVAAAQLRPR